MQQDLGRQVVPARNAVMQQADRGQPSQNPRLVVVCRGTAVRSMPSSIDESMSLLMMNSRARILGVIVVCLACCRSHLAGKQWGNIHVVRMHARKTVR
jgi:hypothetical protein